MGLDLNVVLSSDRHHGEFLCKLCHQLTSLDSVVTNCCSHPFCRRCYQDFHGAICPCCKIRLPPKPMPGLLESQPLAFRVLARVKVGCPLVKRRGHNNCAWTGNYGDLAAHIAESHPAASTDLYTNPNKKNQPNLGTQQPATTHHPQYLNNNNNNNNTSYNGNAGSRSNTPQARRHSSRQRPVRRSMVGKSKTNPESGQNSESEDSEGLVDGELLVGFGNRPAKKAETSAETASRIIQQRRAAAQAPKSNREESTRNTRTSLHPFPNGIKDPRDVDAPKKPARPSAYSPVRMRGNRVAPVPAGGQREEQRMNPGSTGAHNVAMVFKEKAGEAFRAGSYGDAIQFYKQAIETMAPHQNVEKVFCASLYSNRAASYLRANKFQECIQDCDGAIELNAETHKAYLRKGWALVEMGDLEEACATLALGVRNCNSQELEFELNFTKELRDKMSQLEQAMEGQDYPRAINVAASIRNSEKHKKIQLHLSKAYLGLGDTNKAIEKANYVLGGNILSATNSIHVEGLQTRAKAFFWSCNFREATRDAAAGSHNSDAGKELLQRIRTVEKSLQDARNSSNSSNSKRAAEIYNFVIEQVMPIPHSVALFQVLHMERAEALLASSDAPAALKDADMVIASKFDHVRAWQVKVKALNDTSQFQKLQSELQKVVATPWGSSQQFLKIALEEAKKKLEESKKKTKPYVKLHGPDYYKILEVERDAPIDVIRKAYRKKCMKYHPDKLLRQNLTDAERKEAEAIFKMITEAMDFLKEPEWRKMYDQGQNPHGIRQAALHKMQDSTDRF